MSHHLKKITLWAIVFCAFTATVPAQTGRLHVRIRVENYASDSLWFGRSFGRRAVAERPFLKNPEGIFDLEIERPAAANACAAVVYEPQPGAKKAFLNVLLSPEQSDFEMAFDVKKPVDAPVFRNSEENEALYRYDREVGALRKKRDDAQNAWRLSADEPSFRAVCAAEKSLADFQAGFLAEKAHPFTSAFVRNWPLALPVSEWTALPFEQAAVTRQQWLKTRYLDRVDIVSESFWRTPLALDWLDFFVFKSSPASPDSTRYYAETVLNRLEQQPEEWHYYFNYMLNSFEGMSRFYFDEVFAYLVGAYVETGKTPGYSAGVQQEKIEAANKIRRLKVGNRIPSITLFDEKGQPVALDSIDAEWLFLVFFQPDCSHCKKETGLLKALFEKYQSRGLRVAMVCGRLEGQLPACWQFQKDFELPADWLMLADGQRRSDFRNQFKVDGFPRLFLLDKDKRIRYRRAGEASMAELEKILLTLH